MVVSLEDSLWAFLGSCLPLLRRLLLLSPLSRDTTELLARRIVVHWGWLYKRLLPTVQEVGCGSLALLLQEYKSGVRRRPAYCSRSSSKLRRLLGVSQPPPSTQEQCFTLSQLLALDSCPLLSSPLHLATFHCQYGS